ncbi:MAG: MFS transporter [Planctomycetes bacterium]|nr:MFS transporter [Planctomycetota bacterium]MCB9892235.1 MFS transporter [Planctomycetota bacterium]
MSSAQRSKSSGGDTFNIVRLSIMMFLQFFVWGAWWATMGACLKSASLSGIIADAYSSQPVAAIVAPLFLGLIADRYFASERVMGVLHLVGGGILLAVPLLLEQYAAATDAAARTSLSASILGLCYLHMLCYMPTIGLSNSVAFSNISSQEKFPIVRVLGTIGWIVAGWVVAERGWSDDAMIFNVAGGAGVLLGLYSFSLPHTPAPQRGEKMNLRALLMVDAFKLMLRPAFFVFILCSTLICIPLSYYYAYISVYLPQLGFADDTVSFTMSFGQVSEIFFMLLIPFFFRRLGVKWMLLIGMLAWVARYILFAMAAPDSIVWMAYAGIILHGICYDFFFVTGYMYTDKAAPAKVRSQAQSLVVFFTLGVGMFFGYAMAGQKYAEVVLGKPTVVADEAPAGFIPMILHYLNFAPRWLTNQVDSLVNPYLADLADPWQQFWALPAVIAGAVMILFALLFWDRVKTDE